MMTRHTLAAFVVMAASAATVAAQHQHSQDTHGHDRPAGQAATQPLSSQLGVAQDATSLAGPHGGRLQEMAEMQVETVIEPGGLRIFAYDRQGHPLELNRARGLATLQIAGDAKRYRYDLFPEIGRAQSAESLAVAVDLTGIAGREVTLTFQLVGVAGAEQRPARFTTVATVPMTAAQQVAAAIDAQGVCPVSGHPLGGMGKPIPVTIGDQTVYVCCAGCIDAVKSNPTKYLVTKPTLTVTVATDADAAAIARQKLCPVMDEPLGAMGPPLKVTGLGRDVFLCCKGCLKFLEKEPQKYLAKLSPLPELTVVKATEVDARFIAAQKTCPVMDEPLDAMGGPYKTVVNGRVVYLCCPGCAKKLHATPEAFLQKLADQGIRPPVVR